MIVVLSVASCEVVKKLLLWNEVIQERFLAANPFECKAYKTDAKAMRVMVGWIPCEDCWWAEIEMKANRQ